MLDGELTADSLHALNARRRRKGQCQRCMPREALLKLTDGLPSTVVLSIATLYALFGDDLRLLAFSAPADIAFEALSTLALALFCVEIVLNAFAKPEYIALPRLNRWRWRDPATWFGALRFGSFYLWLDIIAAASLIVEARRAPPAA